MTTIYTSPIDGKKIEIVSKHFFNLYELISEYMSNSDSSMSLTIGSALTGRDEQQIPESLKYHDICIGVLNTGDVFMGESCPAKIEEYRQEMARELSERDMVNQAFAARSYILKTERSDHDPLPEAGYILVNGLVSFVAPKLSCDYLFEINKYLKLDYEIPTAFLAITALPQGYTATGISQCPIYRESLEPGAMAMLKAYMGIYRGLDMYRRFVDLK